MPTILYKLKIVYSDEIFVVYINFRMIKIVGLIKTYIERFMIRMK